MNVSIKGLAPDSGRYGGFTLAILLASAKPVIRCFHTNINGLAQQKYQYTANIKSFSVFTYKKV